MCPTLGLLVQRITHMLERVRRAIPYIGLLQGVLFVSTSQGACVHVLGTGGVRGRHVDKPGGGASS